MAYEYIHVNEQEGVLVITMDDPKTRNAIGYEMFNEISLELDHLENDPNLRCLVLTGKDPAFCSGANVQGMARGIEQVEEKGGKKPLPEKPWDAFEERLKIPAYCEEKIEGVRSLPILIHHLQKPSIAAVNGYAMGLGLGIALSCDIRFSSEKANFSETFILRGLIPADGSCWQLPRMIGLSNTLMLQYTGDRIDPETALRMGLISKICSHEKLMEETLKLAKRLANGPTYAMGVIKSLLQRSLEMNFEESMKLAGTAQTIARDTYDHKEGVQAFIEKRKPEYKGR
ncbi:enoyl-CoA hydratase/isomerase family protein [Thermodesulfobacteriota bacterium]